MTRRTGEVMLVGSRVKLYLIRHAEAVSEEVAGGDHDRWLSPRGREAARGLARLLREQRVELDTIISSPLPRALQTAELVAAGLDVLGAVDVEPALAPGFHPRRVIDGLRARGQAIAIVGHEPTISVLTAMLLGQPAFPAFRTGQCCAIERGAPTFTARSDVMQVHALFLE
ncbi:MAG: phosphoglycerate mutase family protein [Kofleriaceae bacterium]